MPELERDTVLELAHGVRLRSSGLTATVGDVTLAADENAPVSDVEPGALRAALTPAALAPRRIVDEGEPLDEATVDGLDDLGVVAEAAGMRRRLTVPVESLTASGGAYLELSVPPPAEDEGQVVLEVDEAGIVRWHLPVAAPGVAAAATPGQTFRIPVRQPHATAFFGGLVLRKVLHLVRFPVEKVGEKLGEFAVGAWERRNRPHRLGLLTPETFGKPLPDDGPPAAQLADLADKPFLLLVHGTFSTIRGGFNGLTGDTFAELHRRYEGRVLGFDHPTLYLDPTDNVDWLLPRLPTDRPLTLDLVTHSRGGLVGRHIAAKVNVRTLVHVGTPNAGTVLASPSRWTTLIDVLTNLFSLLPDEPATMTAEAVVELVKQLAAGMLGGLDGLAAMDPADAGLKTLNSTAPAGATTIRAIASDYTPTGALRMEALNLLVDGFFHTGNDLVVPTESVFNAGDYAAADPYLVPKANGVAHTAFFRDATVRAKLLDWLPG